MTRPDLQVGSRVELSGVVCVDSQQHVVVINICSRYIANIGCLGDAGGSEMVKGEGPEGCFNGVTITSCFKWPSGLLTSGFGEEQVGLS